MTRTAAIMEYRKIADAEKRKKDKEDQAEWSMLRDEILGLSTRIHELIETALECMRNGIEINTCMKSGRYNEYDDNYKKGTFVANENHCYFGFIPAEGDVPIKGIGSMWHKHYGDPDIFTDGEDVYSIKTSKDGCKKIISAGNHEMIYFLKHFDEFEQAFYLYVDGIISDAVARHEKRNEKKADTESSTYPFMGIPLKKALQVVPDDVPIKYVTVGKDYTAESYTWRFLEKDTFVVRIEPVIIDGNNLETRFYVREMI